MADKTTNTKELKMNWGFADGDTRLQTLTNPQNDLTASDVKTVESLAVSTQPIIGDKNGASLTGLVSATIADTTEITVDLTGKTYAPSQIEYNSGGSTGTN